MKNYRVNLGYAGYSNATLSDFTAANILCLTGNASFPALPVPVEDLTTLQTGFATARANSAQGGKQLTALTRAARTVLITALRKNAAYVQSIASQDDAMILSSGYLVNSTNRTPAPLLVPTITAITNEATTTLTVRVQPVNNARAYQVRYCVSGGAWLPTVDSTQTRRIMLTNLTPGTTYTVQSRAVGGSTGYSNWSDPVSHMAM